MRRRLFDVAAALSLLLTLAGAAAWGTSHARPSGWRLVATAHSADLVRVHGGPHAARFTTAPNWSKASHHGFWDAWWALSRSGRLTLLAQVIDYEGTLHAVQASPPSLVVDVTDAARSQVTVFSRLPESGPRANRLGFAWQSDAQPADDVGGPVGARAWIVTLPYWCIVLLGVPMPLLWFRAGRRRRAAARP